MKTLLPILLLLTACRSGTPQPVSIEPGDICAFCKMAISQPVYAAQFIDKDGNAHKFDDIGCMVHYVEGNKLRESAAEYFVMDYNERRWVKASEATYVKSESSATPMGSGLTAFAELTRAREFGSRSAGQVFQFDHLWGANAAEPFRPKVNPR